MHTQARYPFLRGILNQAGQQVGKHSLGGTLQDGHPNGLVAQAARPGTSFSLQPLVRFFGGRYYEIGQVGRNGSQFFGRLRN